MSVVTGIMLMVGVADWENPPFEEVQQWLEDNCWPKLKDVSECAGGGKHPQFEAWSAGFNHFSHFEQEFAEFVLSREWCDPRDIILIMNPEEGPMSVFQPAIAAAARSDETLQAAQSGGPQSGGLSRIAPFTSS